MMTSHTFKTTFGHDTSRISTLVEEVLEACSSYQTLHKTTRFRMALALEEAITNAVIHGNLEVDSRLREKGGDEYEQLIAQRKTKSPYKDRMLQLECQFSPKESIFIITDEGPGFDVSQIPDPTEEPFLHRPCGRGMLIMRTFMDAVEYNETGNQVTLVKVFDPQSKPAPPVREPKFFEAQQFTLNR